MPRTPWICTTTVGSSEYPKTALGTPIIEENDRSLTIMVEPIVAVAENGRVRMIRIKTDHRI